MKLALVHIFLFLISAHALALGDNSGLPNPTRNMKDTASTLNQVTPEQEEKEHPGPQDMQERMYQEQQAQEKKEWEEQKRNSDYNPEEQPSE